MRQKSVLVVLTFFVLVVSLATLTVQVYLYASQGVEEKYLTARASAGYVDFCINGPPDVQVPCNATLSQNTSYFCQLNVTDIDGNGFVVTQQFNGTEIFNISTNGTINFTPTNGDVGNHSVTFFATDDSGCANGVANATFSFSVVNINDPPFLARTIPDQSFASNSTLSAFFLIDYFSDPDGDLMNFTSTSPPGITVTILPSSEVRFTSSTCLPDGELVVFTAIDPFGASAESNPVEITVTCTPAESSTEGGDAAGGGGGGGGGDANVCESNWDCQEWFPCLPTDIQWRRCYDLNGCEIDKYLRRMCEYAGPASVCPENWLCSDWGRCFTNETQYRSCEDLNECGTELVKPAENQQCVYIASCDDGIQNGDETGVDCGGECSACPLVQKPSPIVGKGGLSSWIVFLVILSILLISGVLRYYRAEIAQMMAKIGFLMKHRAFKEVLLDAAQRKVLFESIGRLERQIALGEIDEERVYDRLGVSVREYVRDALVLELEALPEEVLERCHKLDLHKETTLLITDLFKKLELIEQEELEYDEHFVRVTIEELRTLVCLTSQYEQSEIQRPIEEVVVNDEMSFYDEIFVRMTNVLRAVQFDQLDIAKKEYVKLLTRYDPLSEQEKEEIYPELLWAFRATRFQSEITGSKVVEKPAVT